MKKYAVLLSGNGLTQPGYFQRIEELEGDRGRVICTDDRSGSAKLSFGIAQCLAVQFRKSGFVASLEAL